MPSGARRPLLSAACVGLAVVMVLIVSPW